jgi:hypothetical protein
MVPRKQVRYKFYDMQASCWGQAGYSGYAYGRWARRSSERAVGDFARFAP